MPLSLLLEMAHRHFFWSSWCPTSLQNVLSQRHKTVSSLPAWMAPARGSLRTMTWATKDEHLQRSEFESFCQKGDSENSSLGFFRILKVNCSKYHPKSQPMLVDSNTLSIKPCHFKHRKHIHPTLRLRGSR